MKKIKKTKKQGGAIKKLIYPSKNPTVTKNYCSKSGQMTHGGWGGEKQIHKQNVGFTPFHRKKLKIH